MSSRRGGGMCECMKLIKRIFFFLMGLILAGCLGVIVCALNPSLTRTLAERVQALQPGDGTGSGASGPVPGEDPRGEGELPEAVPGVNADWLGDRETNGYLVPFQMPEDFPEEVNGLWGYEPVEGDAEQIAREEAENLSEILADNVPKQEFSLPEEYYPYYQMLEPKLQRLYLQIFSNLRAGSASFAPKEAADQNEVALAFEAVFNDHPELYAAKTGYRGLFLDDGICAGISLSYYEDLEDYDAAEKLLTERETEILTGGASLGSDYEKVKYVHDLLAETVEYDLNAPMNQSAYSAMVNGETVCAGYARAFQLLMQDFGIPCFYCTGFAGEDHAWNIVELDGKYYNVDVTWDDVDPLNYHFFNKTDAEFAGTHVRTGLSVYLPACTGTLYGDSALQGNGDEETEESAGESPEESTEESPAESPAPTTLEHPLTWTGRGGLDWLEPEESESPDREHQDNLDKAGISEEDVLNTLQEYYDDCKKQLKAVGVGEKQFTNVVPQSLWSSIESAYSSGGYQKGYVEEALKDLKAESFAIQIQVQNLGGGYYRIWHNVMTY